MFFAFLRKICFHEWIHQFFFFQSIIRKQESSAFDSVHVQYEGGGDFKRNYQPINLWLVFKITKMSKSSQFQIQVMSSSSDADFPAGLFIKR